MVFTTVFAVNTVFWVLAFLAVLSLPSLPLASYMVAPLFFGLLFGIPVLWLFTFTYSLARLSGPDPWLGALWAPAAAIGAPLMLALLISITIRQMGG